ncbi:carboxylesterase/lipase family protein [Streptomyces scabiei]|uniref:carboxylesterase/lipase family protein n=1 Tax=Streptomyces scabiei TaxID=1930 RepID=UPI0038F66342
MSESAQFPMVRTSHGSVRGTRWGDTGGIFAGIPFAAPPIGPLRLRPPAPVAAWTGVRDSVAFPAAPAQRYPLMDPSTQGSLAALDPRARAIATALGAQTGPSAEDCLYLNLWTPELTSRRPVLVWIYGGGFETGSASPPAFDGAALSRLTGAVVVAVNYRVGALGWLLPTGPGSERFADSANLGLQDQAAGLRWVRDNVAAFGGDPDNVTVAGNSAGAFSIGALLSLPAAAGTFHKAILHSGSTGRVYRREAASAVTQDLLSAVGVRNFESLTDVPLHRILDAQSAVIPSDIGLRHLPDGHGWGIVHDGPVLPHHPHQAVRAGAAKHIPLLIGANDDEARMYASFGADSFRPTDEAALIAEMRRAELADPHGLLDAYRARGLPATDQLGEPTDDLLELRTRFLGDAIYRVPSARLARAQTAAGGRVHTYLISAEPFGPGSSAFHGAELIYLGDKLTALDIDTPGNQAIREELTTAWSQFLATGEPGWPAFDSAQPESTRLIGGAVTFVTEPAHDIAGYWIHDS